MEDGFMKTWQECCDYFNVNTERGLTTDQVKKNIEKYGPNGKTKLYIIFSLLYCARNEHSWTSVAGGGAIFSGYFIHN